MKTNLGEQPSLSELSRSVSTRLRSGQTVVIFGIGSELLGDDRAGVAIARAVQELKHPLLKGVVGCSAPENVTGEVISHKPSLVVIVDAASMNLAPGSIRLLPVEQISGISFSTHSLPLSLIVSYIQGSLSCEFLIAGIEPLSTQFSQSLTQPAQQAVDQILNALLPSAIL